MENYYMKYARFSNQYKYQMQKRPDDWTRWPRDGNIGDCIQSIAVENIYQKAGINVNDILLVNRDDLNIYDGEECQLVMNAWFGNYAGIFPLPWSDKVKPIFLGFHLNTINNSRQRFLKEKIFEKMMPYQPIGCRDRNTANFLKECGLNTYFSGCITLTFDKRKQEPENGKIFIIDLTKQAYENLPLEIKEKADMSITHFYYWNEYPVTVNGAKEFEQEARKILKRYEKEASLVITSKIHVAMPYIAMGIPVIFINEDIANERFDVLRGLIPMYETKHMHFVDWNPKPANIESLKAAIINNAISAIKGQDQTKSIEKLNNITSSLIPIDYLPKNTFFQTSKKGNFLCQHKFKHGYVKTYVLGICVKKKKYRK